MTGDGATVARESHKLKMGVRFSLSAPSLYSITAITVVL